MVVQRKRIALREKNVCNLTITVGISGEIQDKIFMLLSFPSTFSSSKQKLKHKLNITIKKKKTKNSHKAFHKIEEDLDYADHVGKVEENEHRPEQLAVKKLSVCSV